MSHQYQYDVVIVGAGAAGLTLALNLPKNYRIALLSKGNLKQGSTYRAQGGMAAVIDNEDSIASHVEDTINAGAGLCRQSAVEFTVSHSGEAVQWLVEQGVKFTRQDEDTSSPDYHLTREGGHSHRRIIHAADATGRVIAKALINRVSKADNIDIFTDHIAIDLIKRQGRCQGAYVFDRSDSSVHVFSAPAVVLATGGASKAYLYTSNSDGASGDGIAIAWRAGCRVANLEFNQFHPTCLYHPQAKTYLITEAVRGEGGRLLLPNGEAFMSRFDERGELAPRDIVARAIDFEMKRLGADCLYLDISHKPADFLRSHFPTVMKRCQKYGIDITSEPIPVVPAAHYTCGGVVVDTAGRTDVPGLYAIGETSCTGLHGANRMASNSLLECVVYARSAAAHIQSQRSHFPAPVDVPGWDESRVTNSDEDVVISHNWNELRHFMWDYVGIVRTDKRLQRARNRIRLLQAEIAEYYSNHRVSNDLLELRNLAMVAELMIHCAMQRKESRGLHYTLDYPDTHPVPHDTVLTPPI